MEGWFTSSASRGRGCCVEVLLSGETVAVRDSKQWRTPGAAGGPIIVVSRDEWLDFLHRLVHGGASTGSGRGLVADLTDDGYVAIVDPRDSIGLRYTTAEWIAFLKGVRSNEFTGLAGASA